MKKIHRIILTGVLVITIITCLSALATGALFFIFFAMKQEKAGKAGAFILAAGFAAHTLALITRGIGAGRLPLTNQYEFATCFAWGLCLVSLVFIWRYHFQALGTFAAPVIFIIMGYAAMQSKEVRSLMPSLRSNWLAFHVSTAIISYGAFGVSFAISLMFLLREKMEGNPFWEKHVPDHDRLDLISYRAVSLGLLFLTFVIITGAIWAEKAWGSYWSWPARVPILLPQALPSQVSPKARRSSSLTATSTKCSPPSS